MEQELKNYEIAYLLSSSISEADVLTYATQISTCIEEQKGTIKHLQEPRKHKLAYAIKKEKNAYFGWTTFHLLPEHLAELEKKLKTNTSILRYLLIEEETWLKARTFRAPSMKPELLKMNHIPRETEKFEEKLDLEALDKKLEEILGK